ncbi:MAG: hypothetical protein ACM31C_35315 [Acidobacteriota bacterium]
MKTILACATSMALGMASMGGYALAKGPAENIGAKRHPSLAAAQRLTGQAYDKIVAAQKANEWDLGGHAQKAKEMLETANHELKLAAETANEHR